MSGNGRPAQKLHDGGAADAGPACVALVPVVQATEWTRTASQQPSRPASTFVTQLLATAERAQQTRGLRRATAADARTAYSASQRQVQVQTQARIAGNRTRQII